MNGIFKNTALTKTKRYFYFRITYHMLFLFCIVDVNECYTGTHGCHKHAHCINTDDSYICHCRGNWAGDGRSCSGNFGDNIIVGNTCD